MLLSSTGRGGALDEKVGSSEAESAGHQLCGHTVRIISDGKRFISVDIEHLFKALLVHEHEQYLK